MTATLPTPSRDPQRHAEGIVDKLTAAYNYTLTRTPDRVPVGWHYEAELEKARKELEAVLTEAERQHRWWASIYAHCRAQMAANSLVPEEV